MHRRLISVTLTAVLLASSAAIAQPDQKRDKPAGDAAHGGGQPHAGGRPAGGPAHAAGGQAQTDRGPARGPSPGAQVRNAEPAPAQERGARTDNPSRGPVATTRQSQAARQPNQMTRQAPPPRAATRGAVNPGGRQFVYQGRSHEAIRGPSYSYPSGWNYRRWDSGQSLPLLFLTSRYFFSDYGRYGFGPPPSHYVWVRYGPDLLLVNRRTGRIRQVIYGAFY
jgi:Ni/Co efflux regulator RcnB